jgi:hypothetical protein
MFVNILSVWLCSSRMSLVGPRVDANLDVSVVGSSTIAGFIGYIPSEALEASTPTETLAISSGSYVSDRDLESTLESWFHAEVDALRPSGSKQMHEKIPKLLRQMKRVGGMRALRQLENRVHKEGAMHTLLDELQNTLTN